MRDLSIGPLRSRISLETAVATPDGAGGETIIWQTIATVWARLSARSGRESFDAHGTKSAVRHTILVRPHVDVLPSRRFRLGQRMFHIHAVRPLDQRNRRLICDCEEINL
jgi:SPP1 family predicted phage head-tail adaptor